MKKKVISLMLIGAMVASMAACGSNGGSDNGNAANGNDTSAAAESDGGASEGGNTLTVWTWDPAFNIPAIKEAGNIYKADHPDFELKVVETLSDDCETKLITAAESGDLSTLPDIVLMQDNSYQKFVSIYPEAFTDLTDSGIDFSQFAAGKLSYSTVDGKNYGVPFDNGAVIGAYRTDYLEQAGYTIDDLTDIDWNRFIEIAKDVKEKTGKYMLSGQADSPDMVMEMLQSAGASLFDKDGKPAMTDNAALKECISIYQKMVEEGVYYEVNNWDDYVSSITTGQVAGVINGNWISATIMGMKDTSGKWAITNIPKLIETPNATNYSNNGGSSWYITSNCKNKDLAIDFLKSTFAGSVKLYENILPTTGAIGTYAPAADSTAYQEPQEFWNNQPIFAKIVDFSLKTPTNNTSPYYYDGRNAIGTQIQNIMNGADVDQAIADAQAEVEFTMGE
ncbi:MAG: extracellular solute-binding protein [Lachnospiraceae bacterium]|nr:extracellular solute-binding protein [Lachnospiraceae bacterium]